ncbi:hypothetical protein LCGC14_2175800 [marine sediment metagenome]|uniref:Uncharacterized protein n=1 Tax=marine sediment metagenome TaxID=412755 RepID=A0A0F9DNT7_9ZZZZ
MSLYTVRINVANAAPLDGVTPIDLATATVTQSKTGDRTVEVDIPADAFGILDPGELVDQDGKIFQMLSLSVISDATPIHAAGSEVRVQSSPTTAAVTREVQAVDLDGSPGIFPSLSKLFPVGHKIVFDTVADGGASGPHMIQIGLCSLEPDDCALVSAQQACCVAADSKCCTPVTLSGLLPRGAGVLDFPMQLTNDTASINVVVPGCNLQGVTVTVKRSTLGASVGALPTINGVAISAASGVLPETIDIDVSTTGGTLLDNFLLVLTATCGCCTVVPIELVA